MSSNFLTTCISCQQQVRPYQEGLQCDGCLRWQHRTWSTDISQSEYWDAVKTTASINWHCSTCDASQSEIPALSEISHNACLYILGTRTWTPGYLQKWLRHRPTHKASYGFTIPPCWKDWKKIPTTPAASNCQTLAGFLQLHPWELDQKPDLPATDLERVPGSRQDH